MIGTTNAINFLIPHKGYFLINEEYLLSSSVLYTNGSGSHTVYRNLYNVYDGVRFTGRNTGSGGDFAIRCAFTIDITEYNYLSYKLYGYIHGKEMVRFINPNNGTVMASYVTNYNSYSLQTWVSRTRTINTLTGNYTVQFGGGYSDSSGNASSYTQYAQIIFYDNIDTLTKYGITI